MGVRNNTIFYEILESRKGRVTTVIWQRVIRQKMHCTELFASIVTYLLSV